MQNSGNNYCRKLMGLIICDKHGEQGIAINIEDVICQKILADEPISDEHLHVIKVLFYDDEEFLMDMNYLISTALKDDLNLLEVYEVQNEEEDSALMKRISPRLGIVCGQCLKEYKYRNNIEGSLRKLWRHTQI